MKKGALIIILAVLAGLVALGYFFLGKSGEVGVTDYKNIEFTISGEKVRMVNGASQDKSVRYFGNEIKKDLDGDGVEDMAFLLTHNPGGSGTFYYLVGALKRGGGYIGTHAVLIGDRIAPQTTNSGPGRQVVVNYADRRPSEPFTTAPSVGKSLYLLLDPNDLQFGEVVQNFEGESSGQINYQVNYINSSKDLIQIELPFPGAVTGKEFSVLGKARGNWYFEASFPIDVLDKNGKVLVQTHAEAQGDWMTTNFVPFKAVVKVPANYIGPATLVLKKDNPSGLPQYDASASFHFTIEY